MQTSGPDRRRALGAEGEMRAAAHLEAAGWRLLARNVRAGGVEIDLIAERGATLAFVEVKSRRARSCGAPEEAVDARKRARLVRGAAAWLAETRPGGWRQLRFDVICCETDGAGRWTLRHLEDAFDADG